jgi:protocatechuate 3,4-dioxygenase beta subunit
VTIIQGCVIDPQSHPVAEAAVYIVSSPVSMPDTAQLTDEQGRFTISVPVPGRYTVGVRSEGGDAVQTEVEIKGEEPVSIEVQITAREE